MEQVEGPDVQGGGYGHPSASLHQPLGELDTPVSVVKAAVDVRGRDLHQPRRAQHLRGRHDDAHGQGRGFPAAPGEELSLPGIEPHVHEGVSLQ